MQREMKLPALDGLRGVAILLVLMNHGGWVVYPRGGWPPVLFQISRMGYSGVELFFALSGFLLFLPYARALLDRNVRWPSARRYFTRRVLRILPVYFAFLAALTVFVVVTHTANRAAARSLIFMGLLIHNFDTGAFSFMIQHNSVLWTLPVEWHFYLILPWLALGLAWVTRRRLGWLLGVLGAVAVVSLAVQVWYVWQRYGFGYVDPLDVPGKTGLLTTVLHGTNGYFLDAFAVGMAGALIYARLGSAPRPRTSLVLFGLAAIGITLCAVWDFHSRTDLGASWPDATVQGILWTMFGDWCLTLCYTLLLLAALWAAPGSILHRACTFGPLCFVGTISYSLYMWHAWVFLYTPDKLVPLIPVLLVGIGVVSYYLIERPFLQWRMEDRGKTTGVEATSTGPAVSLAIASASSPPVALLGSGGSTASGDGPNGG